MLQIGKKSKARGENDPEGMLLDCHERIRGFSTLSVQLASPDPAGDEAIKDAAMRIHRYYTVALSLHQADEEQTLPSYLAPSEALATMRAQHVALDRALEPLVKAWERIAADPARRAEVSLEQARAVDALWVEHLGLEETQIFPLLRTLPEKDRMAIAQEMRARRG